MKQGRGFTVIEVMTVLIILAILATLAVPPFIKTMDAAKGRLAKTNLKLIYAAEKVYRNEVGEFMPYDGGTATQEQVNRYLGLDIKLDQKDFSYEVISKDGGINFEAVATYKGTRYPSPAQIMIDQEGAITSTFLPSP